MADKEKVIRGLECCIGEWTVPECENCPYEGTCERLDGLFKDALALLKAQEPEECENVNKSRIFCCSVCEYEVSDIFIDEQRFEYPSINFCPNCGKRVKWDA